MPRNNRNAYPRPEYGRINNGREHFEDFGNEMMYDDEEDAIFEQELDEEDYLLNEDEDDIGIVSEDEMLVDEEDMDFEDDLTLGSDLYHHLKNVSDEVLTTVAAGCLERVSDCGFKRFLAAHNADHRREALALWKNDTTVSHKLYICNRCGVELDSISSCCGPIITYHRVGGITQLHDLTREYISEILAIRRSLRTRQNCDHNLNGAYLSRLWKSERRNELNLSLIGSIDGVNLTGNTRNKIWPVTLLLVDLPTAEMQKDKNLSIHGIAEGSANPSTVFWNRIIPLIYVDIEEQETKISNLNISYSITSWTADQPAKRELFGMKGFNSEGTCFFGLCSGTLYKQKGPLRSILRPDMLTNQDSENGVRGFKPTPAEVVKYVNPYDTIVDILHNACEGLIPLILSETQKMDRNYAKHSTLFDCDVTLSDVLCKRVILPTNFEVEKLKSGSDNISFFRLNFGLSALVNSTLQPEARLVICSLMLVMNKLYTNAPNNTHSSVQNSNDLFFTNLTSVAEWVLGRASKKYLATKSHELLCHLSQTIQQFGNVAALSTFSYEHYYKYCLKGFSPHKTTGFTEAAISRVILHSAVPREMKRRVLEAPSETLTMFMANTPDLKPFEISWKHPIKVLNNEDKIPQLNAYRAYATLTLSVGLLQSSYKNISKKHEILFAVNTSGRHCCYRFCAVFVLRDTVKIVAERIDAIDVPFPLLQEDAARMIDGKKYAKYVLNYMKEYAGIVHGRPSGAREVISPQSVKGVGSFLQHRSAGYYCQINGACVHH